MSARSASRTAIKAVAAAMDKLRRPAPGVVVLLYHRVGARTPMSVDLPASLFDEQMAWLAAQRTVLTMDDALATLVQHHAGPDQPDPVVVTFDDGTADLVDIALPILSRYRLPALFYLATDFIERARPFPYDGVPLSWAAVRDAVSTGLVDIGSHTHTHALLDRIEPDAAASELERSCQLIEDRAGVEATDFAYPKAVPPSVGVDRLVRARFRSAALGGCRANPYGRTDPYRLARSAIQRSDGMRWFEHKASGGLAFEDDLRRTVNRRRYAGAVT